MEKYKVGMLLFPHLTILDFTGPYEVFVRAPCMEVIIVSENTAPFKAEGGLSLQAGVSFDDCPLVDILFVPGGRGINPLLTNKKYHDFLRKQAAHAQYITAVCTGSLLLAACGLLKGHKATTHWRSVELLELMGTETVKQRVVTDRNRITGGGITAGIDFGLVLTAIIGGEDLAKTIQLQMEYNPKPPFQSGSPEMAEPPVLQKAKEITQDAFDKRLKIIQELQNL